MKFTYLSRTASVLAVALAAVACDDGLTDINKNPNAPTDVTVRELLPQAIQASVGTILGTNFHLTLTGLWAQHFAKVQYIDEDRYDLRPGTVDAHWANLYSGPLADLHQLIQKGEAANQPNVVGVGLTMQSWTFQAMTDVWGDIPYSEALQGRDEGGTTTPKYDTQQDIYYGMLADLTAASNMIDAGGADPFGATDLIYQGDMAEWQKFANSLRLRMAMRLSEADPAKAQSEFVAALADGVFTSNEDNADLVYTASPPSQNPLFVNFQTRFDHATSKTLIDKLKELDDPRLSVYAEPNAAGEYRGMPNGLPNDNGIKIGTEISKIGTYFLQPETPAVLMSYAEVLFLQAEAAARGWISGDAASLYNQAIRASMEMYGIPVAAIDAYLAQPSVAYNSATGLRQIAEQKWLALFNNGPEAYAEWRRTGYPVLEPAAASVIGPTIPLRVFYPSSEQAFNMANLQAAAQRQGASLTDLTTPVWWDK